jgi:hypothetical protein
MGSVKQYWMEQQELEPMYDWIEDNYGELDEDCEDWEAAVQEYNDYVERLQMEEARANAANEYDYYIYFVLEAADKKYNKDLTELKEFVKKSTPEYPEIFYKMSFAHAVTIFEVYMEDITKSLLLHNDEFLNSFIRNGSKVLSAKKYSLKDFLVNKQKIASECEIGNLRMNALLHLSGTLFHDITKLLSNFEGILGRGLTVENTEIRKVVGIRHDIVHRNGVSKKGASLSIDKKMVLSGIQIIEEFSKNIRDELSQLLD